LLIKKPHPLVRDGVYQQVIVKLESSCVDDNHH